MPKRRNPRMGPIGPSKAPVSEEGGIPQVETTKIDPQAFLEGAVADQFPQGVTGAAEGDRELEQMNFRASPVKAAVEAQKEKQNLKQAEQHLPPEEDVGILDKSVTNDLIGRLEERFGMKPEVLFNVALEAGGEKMMVSMRLPLYDDFIWAIAIIENAAGNGEDLSLLQTSAQREQMLKHVSSCRCVLKIEGEWIWDIFKMRDQIQKQVPHWKGERMVGVPDYFQGILAQKVHALFRHRLHPDLLFEVDNNVDKLLKEHGPKKAGTEKTEETPEDPTEAS